MGPPPERFYKLHAGLHFWRFLNQIRFRKRIGCQLIVFYKNGYHFIKTVTLLPPPPVTHRTKSEHPSMVYVTKSNLLRWLPTVIVQFKISI